MALKVKCNCGNPLTVLRVNGEEIVTDHCDQCSLYAYALGFDDCDGEVTEKTTHADIMADRRKIVV